MKTTGAWLTAAGDDWLLPVGQIAVDPVSCGPSANRQFNPALASSDAASPDHRRVGCRGRLARCWMPKKPRLTSTQYHARSRHETVSLDVWR
jgi:hypothetical protein